MQPEHPPLLRLLALAVASLLFLSGYEPPAVPPHAQPGGSIAAAPQPTPWPDFSELVSNQGAAVVSIRSMKKIIGHPGWPGMPGLADTPLLEFHTLSDRKSVV